MSHKHSIFRPNILNVAAFEEFSQDAALLHKKLPGDIVIRGALGREDPEFSIQAVRFNGDRSSNSHFESFRILRFCDYGPPNSMRRHHCITDGKPYDLLVCAVLLAFLHHFPHAKVRTTGKVASWLPAVELYECTFPERVGILYLNLSRVIPDFFNYLHAEHLAVAGQSFSRIIVDHINRTIC